MRVYAVMFCAFPVTCLWALLLLAGSVASPTARGTELDLRKAVVVTPDNLGKSEVHAVRMLTEEVQKRTLLRWEVKHAWPAEAVPAIAIGPEHALRGFAGPFAGELARRPEGSAAAHAEGFRIAVCKGSGAAPAGLV